MIGIFYNSESLQIKYFVKSSDLASDYKIIKLQSLILLQNLMKCDHNYLKDEKKI